MHTHTSSLSTPNKRASASEHGATIRQNREEVTHKRRRNRPFGVLPARIARVELGIEAISLLDEDERVLEKCQRALGILDRQETHVCVEYGIHHSITTSTYADARRRIKLMREKIRVEMQDRARKLRDEVRPQLVSLTSQADRNAA